MYSSGSYSKLNSSQDLKAKSQTRALQILQKENFESKKSKLVTLLSQQYLSKFGNSKSSQINSIIKESVARFVDSLGQNIDQISPKLIAQFETVLVQDIRSFKESIKQKYTNTQESSTEFTGKEEPKNNSREATHRVNTGDKHHEILLKENFSRINGIYNIVCEEDEKKKKISEKLKKQQEFRETLENQVRSHSKQLDNPYNLSINMTNQINSTSKASILDSLYNSEMKNEENKQKKLIEERKLRMDQINEKKAIKEKELAEKLKEENQEIEYYNRVLEEEKIRKANEKLRLKEMQEQFIQENLRNLELKKSRNINATDSSPSSSSFFNFDDSSREKKNKINLKHEEFLRNMEKQFRETNQKKNDEYERLSDINKNLLHNKLNNINGMNASNSASSLKQKQLECTEFNKNMIEMKKRERELERENDRKYRLELQKLAEKEEIEKKLVKEKKFQEFTALRSELEKQISSQHSQVLSTTASTASMDPSQLKLIEKIENDPQLLHKVLEKMKEPAQAKTSDSIIAPSHSSGKSRNGKSGSSKLAMSGKKLLN